MSKTYFSNFLSFSIDFSLAGRLNVLGTSFCGPAIHYNLMDASWVNAIGQLVRKVVRGVIYGAAFLTAAGELAAPEYAAKASWLTSITDYVKWPQDGSAKPTVGILGDNPFGDTIDKLHPKTSTRVDDLKDCRILFVPRSQKDKVPQVLDAVAGTSILTVGESDGFAKSGGVVGFIMEDGAVKLEINTAAAKRAGLGIDLRLLKLALHIFKSERE